MKIVALACRILLGLMFFVFGLNHVLHLFSLPMPGGDAAVYATLLDSHGFFKIIGLIMVVGGLLLLVGRFVPLALVLLAPIIVNILMYDLLLAPAGILPGAIAAVLEVVLIAVYRKSFYTLFHPAPEVF